MRQLDPAIALYAALPVKTTGLGQLNLPPDSLAAQVAAAREIENRYFAEVTLHAIAEANRAQKTGVAGLRGGFGVIEVRQPRRQLMGLAQAEAEKKPEGEVSPPADRPKPPDSGGIAETVKKFLGQNPNATGSDLGSLVAGIFGQQSATDKKKTDAKSETDGKVKLASMIGGAPADAQKYQVQVSADPLTAAIAGAAAGAAYALVEYLGQKLDQLGNYIYCNANGFEFCGTDGAEKHCAGKLAEVFGMVSPNAMAFLLAPQLQQEITAARACDDDDEAGQFGIDCGWGDSATSSNDYVRNTSIVNYRIDRINKEKDLRDNLTLLNRDERQVLRREMALKGMLAYIVAQTSDIGLDMIVFESNLNWNTFTQPQRDAVQRAVDKQLARVGGGGRRIIEFFTKGDDGKILGMTPTTLGIVSASVVGVGLVSYYVWKKRRA